MSDQDQRVSIYDIAREAGVNPSTVSRALNNRDRISEKTRREILRIAHQLGYQPSVIARSLATRRTNTIGVVAPSLSDPLIGIVINGIEERAGEFDYRVLFSTSRRDPERELSIATNFHRHSVDAVIIVTTHFRSTYRVFDRTLNVPVVIVGQEDPSEGMAVVSVDDRRGIRASFDHLYDLGHRDIAYVGVGDRPFSNESRISALREAARDTAARCTVTEIYPDGGSDLERGRASLAPVLRSGATAVQCYNDMVALGIVGEAMARGRAIPGDLSVVGFDDIEVSRAFPRPLTTVRQHPEEMGRRSVEVAMELVAGHPARREIINGELMVRETTGTPASTDAPVEPPAPVAPRNPADRPGP